VIDDEAFGALRRAATLCHAVPAMRVRVRHEGETLLEISRDHGHEPVPGGGAVHLPPCAFRVAVGRAHALREDGRNMSFLGLGHGDVPSIEIGLPCGGEAWPGGIYQVLEGRRFLYLFATTLPLERCRQLLAEGEVDAVLPAPDASVPGATRIGFHADDATGVTLVHTDVALGADEAEHTATRNLLERLLATCATEELLSELGVPIA
jgi:hypothetical protein